jgi:hypothetical protein
MAGSKRRRHCSNGVRRRQGTRRLCVRPELEWPLCPKQKCRLRFQGGRDRGPNDEPCWTVRRWSSRGGGWQLLQAQAAQRLAGSLRPGRRLVPAWRRAGIIRTSGPTRAVRHRAAEHGLTDSAESLRHWMSAAGSWPPPRGTYRAVPSAPGPSATPGRAPPERRPPGCLAGGGGPRRTLIAFIDDATGEVLAGRCGGRCDAGVLGVRFWGQ